MSLSKPVIVITAGDALGIGPEVTKKALKDKAVKNKAEFIIVGDLDKPGSKKIGNSKAQAGRASYLNIVRAVKILNAIKYRKALVTAPINKASLKKAGLDFSGHTEILSALTGSKDVVMMFAAGYFKLALVTRHLALSKVARNITSEKIIKTTRLFYSALQSRFKILKPKIAVAGLNPHAGDSGLLGEEDEKIVKPAVAILKKTIKDIRGPLPGDTIFRSLYMKELDGVVSMYHDQGLGPFKMLFFDCGVNITLGLPFIRTSPDHGTAFDIAGKNRANPASMIEAVKLAIRLA